MGSHRYKPKSANYQAKERHGRLAPQGSGAGDGKWLRRERIFYCRPCDKWCYPSKKSAKRVARAVHPDETHISAYTCPCNEQYWHYGHDNARLRGQYG